MKVYEVKMAILEIGLTLPLESGHFETITDAYSE
jgi:hypothetical protein